MQKKLKQKRKTIFASEWVHRRVASQLLMSIKNRSLVLTGERDYLKKRINLCKEEQIFPHCREL